MYRPAVGLGGGLPQAAVRSLGRLESHDPSFPPVNIKASSTIASSKTTKKGAGQQRFGRSSDMEEHHTPASLGRWLTCGQEPGRSVPLAYWYKLFLPYA